MIIRLAYNKWFVHAYGATGTVELTDTRTAKVRAFLCTDRRLFEVWRIVCLDLSIGRLDQIEGPEYSWP